MSHASSSAKSAAAKLADELLSCTFSPLSPDAFASILSLTDSLCSAPSPPPGTHAVGKSGPVRIVLWDSRREVKISGDDAPAESELNSFLRANKHCTYYTGQRPKAVVLKRSTAKAAFDLASAVPLKVARLAAPIF